MEEKNYTDKLRDLQSLSYKEWDKVWKSKEFQDNNLAIKNKSDERYKLLLNLRDNRKKIVNKYFKDLWAVGLYPIVFKVDNVKSGVKKGIKNGLGVKHICHIGEDDLIKIIRKLIDEELSTNKEDLQFLEDEKKINKELQLLEDKKKELLSKYESVGNEIRELINQREMYNNRHESNIAETKELIKNKLDELLPKIKEEVTRELVAGALD